MRLQTGEGWGKKINLTSGVKRGESPPGTSREHGRPTKNETAGGGGGGGAGGGPGKKRRPQKKEGLHETPET